MNSARTYHTATLLPTGFLLASGGVAGGSGDDSGLSSAELYNFYSGTWAYTGSMNTGRFSHAAALLPNGLAIVVGGEVGITLPASAEVFVP